MKKATINRETKHLQIGLKKIWLYRVEVFCINCGYQISAAY